MTRGAARGPLPLLAGLLACYLGVPVVAFCVRLAATHQRGFHDPGLFPALAVSVSAASITTAVSVLCGVPLAYLLARSKGRLGSALGVVVQLPLAVPPVMGGILLVYLVGPYTWLGRLFGGGLTETLAGVVLAQTFVASPFLVVAARSSFAAIDRSLEDVAATLGHGPLRRFLRVAVPVAGPGIRAGMVLTWLRAFGEYGATVVLAYHPTSLPVYTFTKFSAGGLPGTMAPTALALGVAAVAVALSRAVRLPRLGAAVPGRPTRRAGGPVGEAAVGEAAVGGTVPGRVPTGAERPRDGRVARAPIGFELAHRLGTFELAVAHPPSARRLAVLGPSGSGKSTLLRCLAGLYGSAPGPVWLGDRRVERIPVERRRGGYVAQAFGLFPHLTVWQQLVFASDADPVVAAYWLAHLRLEGLEARLPSELSGGQRQRVALAQALGRSPEVLLLDEPFAALDTPVRHELQRELRQLQRETGVATVLVTHDPEEAALLADEVMVVDAGRVLQAGAVRDVFRRPASPAVARLVGVPNLCHGVVVTPGRVAVVPGWADGRHGALSGPAPVEGSGPKTGPTGRAGTIVLADTGAIAPGSRVLWSVRPEHMTLEGPSASGGLLGPSDVVAGRSGVGGASEMVGTVTDVAELGWTSEVSIAVAGGVSMRVRTASDVFPAVGDRCSVRLPSGSVSVWPVEDDGRTDRGLLGIGAGYPQS